MTLVPSSSGHAGSPPTGAAGGDLGGSYPNPTVTLARSGAGSPNGLASGALGDLYRDTTHGGLYINWDGGTGWLEVGGGSDSGNVTDGGYPTGVTSTSTDVRLVAAASASALMTDAAGAANSGDGIYWNDLRAADGSQRAAVYTGAGIGGILQDEKGYMRPHAVVINNHAAPADADLAAGDCALWFDQTNGAAKLMVKAKSANGTVATGSVALA